MATEKDKDGMPTIEEQIKAYKEKAEKRAQEWQTKKQERELEAFKAAEEITSKHPEWEQGVKFDVITTDVGVFAVRAPDFTTAKKFSAIAADKRTDEDIQAFVDPCVIYPTNKMLYRSVAQEHGGVPWRLCLCMLAMYEGNAKERMGKF